MCNIDDLDRELSDIDSHICENIVDLLHHLCAGRTAQSTTNAVPSLRIQVLGVVGSIRMDNMTSRHVSTVVKQNGCVSALTC